MVDMPSVVMGRLEQLGKDAAAIACVASPLMQRICMHTVQQRAMHAWCHALAAALAVAKSESHVGRATDVHALLKPTRQHKRAFAGARAGVQVGAEPGGARSWSAAQGSKASYATPCAFIKMPSKLAPRACSHTTPFAAAPRACSPPYCCAEESRACTFGVAAMPIGAERGTEGPLRLVDRDPMRATLAMSRCASGCNRKLR